MVQYPRIAVVTDDPPISDSVLGAGMCRINTQLFRALSSHIDIIVSTTLGGRYTIQDTDQLLRDRCILIDIPKPMRILTRVVGRFIESLRGENIFLKLRLPELSRKITKKSVDWLFCPCGVDPSALGRGLRLSQRTGLPLAVYLVDDFLDGAILSGNKQHLQIAKQNVPSWLKKIDKIFVISEGLRQHLKEKYDVDSLVLPLPYSLPETLEHKEINIKKQVMYLGGLSHFYIDGLRQLAQVIDTINKKHNEQVFLTITSGAPLSQMKSLLGDYDFILRKPCISADAVREEIAQSAICFLPYSFSEKYRVMVSTSFPSKTMDYLAAGKLILVYAPKYSSSVNYFEEYQLPEILNIEDPELLEQIIFKQISQPQDHSAIYTANLTQCHSYSKISEIVMNSLC